MKRREGRLEAGDAEGGFLERDVLLDLKASRRVSESDFRSRSANSWVLGQTVKGQVRLTIAAGRVAFEG